MELHRLGYSPDGYLITGRLHCVRLVLHCVMPIGEFAPGTGRPHAGFLHQTPHSWHLFATDGGHGCVANAIGYRQPPGLSLPQISEGS